MAALILLRYRQRRLLRRNRIFRDRTNPLHKFNDLELFWQFRFRRADVLQMTNELKEELEHLNRKGALPPVFTGRRTALNPYQQWTSIARQTVCPGRLQFPIFLFLFLVVVGVVFLFFSLSEEVFLTAVCAFERQTKFVKSWVFPFAFSASTFCLIFFFRAGKKDWIIWRACVEALITGKPQKEFHHRKITDS